MNKETIKSQLSQTLDTIPFPSGTDVFKGKVRESVVLPDGNRAIVVSDRISAFDFILGTVPFKGQVLNQITAFWFDQVDDLVEHHFIKSDDPNVSIVKNAKPLPIEIVVRGYLTGTTKTSAWYAYQNLDKEICGIRMPDGMKKNEKFSSPIVTPTTKPTDGTHDSPISLKEIVEQGLVDQKTLDQAVDYALKMFARGQEVAAKQGLILVDTKYEMGIDDNGKLIVIDEVHTPDSSRYWIESSYKDRLYQGLEPDMLDKEFVRRMIVDSGYNVDDESQNPGDFLTNELRVTASEKYMELFRRITGKEFQASENAKNRVEAYLKGLL